jgi:hypothetical protein
MTSRTTPEGRAKSDVGSLVDDGSLVDPPALVEPTPEEIDAWAAQEKERRQAWLEGPTDAEKAAWSRRERSRRIGELAPEARAAELARLGQRYGRETQLVAEGAVSLFLTWSRRAIAELARAGREWEADVARPPARRRIPVDDEDR